MPNPFDNLPAGCEPVINPGDITEGLLLCVVPEIPEAAPATVAPLEPPPLTLPLAPCSCIQMSVESKATQTSGLPAPVLDSEVVVGGDCCNPAVRMKLDLDVPCPCPKLELEGAVNRAPRKRPALKASVRNPKDCCKPETAVQLQLDLPCPCFFPSVSAEVDQSMGVSTPDFSATVANPDDCCDGGTSEIQLQLDLPCPCAPLAVTTAVTPTQGGSPKLAAVVTPPTDCCADNTTTLDLKLDVPCPCSKLKIPEAVIRRSASNPRYRLRANVTDPVDCCNPETSVALALDMPCPPPQVKVTPKLKLVEDATPALKVTKKPPKDPCKDDTDFELELTLPPALSISVGNSSRVSINTTCHDEDVGGTIRLTAERNGPSVTLSGSLSLTLKDPTCEEEPVQVLCVSGGSLYLRTLSVKAEDPVSFEIPAEFLGGLVERQIVEDVTYDSDRFTKHRGTCKVFGEASEPTSETIVTLDQCDCYT